MAEHRDDVMDVEDIMEQVRRQQEELERVERDVRGMEVRGHSRDHEVTATMRGDGRFTDIAIDPDTVRRHDPEEIGAIVLEAVNNAMDRLAEATTASYAPLIEAATRAADLPDWPLEAPRP
ncbi:hypothetical protein LX15_003001 [Streptoalloteichus tenebrarius]|uniref:YbaB/EbfC family nucleoid-associated protein n=1 Tax=Streptoalloteichus tenebrarius (strain ATCC 17920 / DSM 40477 / JCM 4838 / CBS 697.72 / NBRC 16177 / NCIMB 11028 / NRRL B-12390 / A12253. 1 / ISP 5477) TaxID=1933 RepID=A0ABT1HUV1_STRSD|nr:YbaB/EbfC family nucleoid-associated protein [Streptoalloteichus tenebrarius]MCP2259300.1 hypothetical protein [Streptoalloteichus tenebrarius]BFE99063.1 YbaB/EbfC family nucleoid-associated protein [Streptoalloteichus tenebrarius]